VGRCFVAVVRNLMTFAFNPTESKNVLWFVVGYKSKVDVKRACGNYFKIFSEISNAHNSQNFLKETKNTTTTLTKGTTNMTASNEISPRAEELRRSDDDFMEEILDDKSTLMIQVSSTTSNIATADKQMAGRPPYLYAPLIMGGNGGTHKPSEGSKALIENEVSLEDMQTFTKQTLQVCL
jgi:hypothetical protein